MTFILKKIVTCAVIPPGIFIISLLLCAIFLRKRLRSLVFVVAVLLYAASIEPTKDLVLIPLEDAYGPPALTAIKTGSAYVVLGGGIYDFAPDIDGKGTLSGDALPRVFCAYRLYRLDRKPIILSGGKVFGKRPEAEIAKRILLSLGVDERDILTEENSRDTYENAKYVKELAKRHNINRIILITSAFHMKRSVMLFDKFFKDTIPFPAGYNTSRGKYDISSYFPGAGNLSCIAVALKEYMGILFYKITL